MSTQVELEALEQINTYREVYNCLFDNLGPNHPGTIKAKYDLGREIIYGQPESLEGYDLIMEVYQDYEDGKIKLGDAFDELPLLYASAIYGYALEDEDRLKAAIFMEKQLAYSGWKNLLEEPNDDIIDFGTLTGMLVNLYEDMDNWHGALRVQQNYISMLTDILHFDDDDMMDAVSEMSFIYSNLDDVGEEEIEFIRNYIEGILEMMDDRYMSACEYVSELKEELVDADRDTVFSTEMDMIESIKEAYEALRYSLGYALFCCEAFPEITTENFKEHMITKIGQIVECHDMMLDIVADGFCDLSALDILRKEDEAGLAKIVARIEELRAKQEEDDNETIRHAIEVLEITITRYALEESIKERRQTMTKMREKIEKGLLDEAADLFDDGLPHLDV